MESKAYYENMIVQNQKRIDYLSRESNELRQKLAQINTQIDNCNDDIEYASAHLNNKDYAE